MRARHGPSTYAFALFISVALGGGAPAAADTVNLVTNGGFETGTFYGFTQSGNPGGTVIGTGSAYAHSGTYGAELGPFGSDGILTQNISTTVGDTYTFSFYFSANGGPTNDFSASFAGDTVLSQSNFQPTNAFQLYTYQVPATSAVSAVQFQFRQDPNFDGLDDISVVDNGPAGTSTPLPAAVWGGAALLGPLGLGAMRHRRSAALA